MKEVPVYIITIMSSIFFPPLSERNSFKLQGKILVSFTDKHLVSPVSVDTIRTQSSRCIAAPSGIPGSDNYSMTKVGSHTLPCILLKEIVLAFQHKPTATGIYLRAKQRT